jgi:hypothetical protein
MMYRNGLLIVIAMTLIGCSSVQHLAMDIGLMKKPVRPGIRLCRAADINSFNSLYIDSSQSYFQNGTALIYGRDGTRCKLRLRYQ